MYTIETKLVPQRTGADGPYPWYTPEQAKNYYGRYSRVGVTIHHWAKNGAGNHDGIVSFFMNRTNGSTNYVLSDNKITKMVQPDDVAWCSQAGNPTTISIEHQSDLGAEGYRKSGWLIAQLEKKYNRTLTLYPHKHWYNTACPGAIDLNRIRQEADKWKGDDMITVHQIIAAHRGFFFSDPPQSTIDYYLKKDVNTMLTDFAKSPERAKVEAQYKAGAGGDYKPLAPGKYVVS